MRENNGFVIWMTGLPSSGKTTIANWLYDEFRKRGLPVEVLDGDVVRREFGGDLGYSKSDRDRNIARVAYVADLLNRHGVIVIVSLVSPYREAREQARKRIKRFFEVYVNCSIEVCVQRDVKGLYRRAIGGEIPNFTGISDAYEPPEQPDMEVETDHCTVAEAGSEILKALRSQGFLPDLGDTQTGAEAGDVENETAYIANRVR